ncbi:uracil phosphoribosyltransferase [Sarracenia purpurea var. burkii]
MKSRSLQLLFFMLLSGIFHLETIQQSSCYDNVKVGCLEAERKALLNFKEGLTDPSGRLSSWAGENCCAWGGVSCNDRTGNVIKLKLRNPFPDSLDTDGIGHQLGGEINPSLLDLKYLTYLDLSMNDFGGIQIPNFLGSLQKLRYLNLSSAYFGRTIPPNLGNLSRLIYLDLSTSFGESYVDDLKWVSSLSSLKYLNLGGVDLSNATSYWLQIVNMIPSLLELHLPQCQLFKLPLFLPHINFTSLSVLDLANNGFNSTIPHWLFNLSALSQLDFNSNNLQGGLAGAFANLCNLEMLTLSVNQFTGEVTEFINGLAGCPNSSLESLDLGYNQLTGNLPISLGYLKNLRFLQLQRNSFSGSIPSSIGNLSALEEFHISENKMQGSITQSLGQLPSLVVLNLSENQWEGVITEAHFANLSRLKDLAMTKTSPNISVVFDIDPHWLPPFKLRYINIRSCQLGPKFPAWLQNQNELKTLVLNNARISDIFPDWFWKLDLQVNELDVAYNSLSGQVPNLLQFFYLSTVDLSSNRFEGPLPLWSSNVSALYLRDNLFSGPIPLDIGEVMPLLTDLDISWNFLTATIPSSISNLKSLTNLAISNNRLSGKIPDFWNDMSNLYFIDMSNNSLSGTLPGSMGSLNFLRFLLLSKNNISGKIPSTLKNCTNMDTLDIGDNQISGYLPAWIGESIQSLLILRARNNSITGNIPSQLCSLPNLHILDLSKNKLSGIIPPCLGNLTGMKTEVSSDTQRYQGRLQVVTKGRIADYQDSILYLVNSLDLSANNLSGDIPKELTSLFKLGTLNLSMNHLTGKIPENIGNFERLETLDLSKNKLSGPIPPGMASLTFLNHLNLSYNNLSGKIPTGSQLLTLNDPSIYAGNVALCGDPLPKKCSDGGGAVPRWDEEDTDGDDEGRFERLWLVISIVLGFFAGFWGVCGTLIINKHCRDAYFHFLGNTKDRISVAVTVHSSRLWKKFNGSLKEPVARGQHMH